MSNKDQKTILFVTPYFLPHGGGLERYAYEIAIRLKKDYGWRIVVITSGQKGNSDTVEDYDGIEVHRLGYQLKLSNTPFSLRWFRKVRRLINEIRPELVDIHMPVPGLGDVAARAAKGYPRVLTYHAGTMQKGKLLPDILIWLYEHIVFPKTVAKMQKIICSSAFVKESLFSGFGERAAVVTPGVDTKVFKPAVFREKNKNEIAFVCNFASMHRLKGLYVLIEAVRSLVDTFPDISIKIIGEKGAIHEKFITFVGPKRGDELVEEIRTSDLLVLSSLAPAESFGMVLIEAMACKLPVVGTIAGGIPEVIEDGRDGFIVPSGNPHALAERIGKLLSDRTLRDTMGEEGFKKVTAQYTWEKKAAETNAILLQVLK